MCSSGNIAPELQMDVGCSVPEYTCWNLDALADFWLRCSSSLLFVVLVFGASSPRQLVYAWGGGDLLAELRGQGGRDFR